MKHISYLLIAFATYPAFVQADVVVLSDGDRFTGTVQKLEDGKLFFESRHSDSPLQIDWKLVASLTTETEVILRRQDGTEHTGRLRASSAGLAFHTSETVTDIQPSTITALKPKAAEQNTGWFQSAWENITLSADFGQSYSGLARYNQFSANSEFGYQGDRWDASMITHFDYYGATGSGNSTYQGYGRFVAQRYIGGDHFFLFPYAFLGRQTTVEGKGQLRQFGGGAGWTFHRHKSDQISLHSGLVRSIGTGFTMSSEEVRTDARVQDLLFIVGASWDKKLQRKITTSLRLYYFKPVNTSGFHAMATDASAKIPLFGPAYLTIRAYDTPQLRQKQLFSTQNLQLSSGIGIEF
jgi:hypothetical protein